jgi:hypothetical protein
VHDAAFSPERIVALPKVTTTEVASAVMAPLARKPRDADLEQIVLICCRHLAPVRYYGTTYG